MSHSPPIWEAGTLMMTHQTERDWRSPAVGIVALLLIIYLTLDIGGYLPDLISTGGYHSR